MENVMDGTCSTHVLKSANTISVGNPEGMRSLNKPGRRQQDNIKADLQINRL